jgi:hypothetical protein
MASFAAPADLADYLQDQNLDTTAAQQALDIATGVIRSIAGWSISQETGVELTLDGRGGRRLYLPTLLLTAVTSIVEDGETLTFGDDYRWSRSGTVRRVGIGQVWPYEEQSIVITFTHGYNPVPDEIIGLCLALAGRQYENPEGLRSWSVDGLSETISNPTSDTGFGLTDVERKTLGRYMLTGLG